MCGGEAKVRTTNRPPDNAFQQQKLKAWQPLLTPTWVIGTFLAVGIIFIPLGIAILSTSNGIFEDQIAYHDNTLCNTSLPITDCVGPADGFLTLNYEFPQDVEAPVYFYYKLTNFYQNHRRYVKSRSDSQLSGAEGASLSSCAPLDVGTNAGGEQLALYPCGLIANSYMNDTFATSLTPAAGGGPTDLTWDDTNIHWQSDLDKFKFRLPATDEIANKRIPNNGDVNQPNVEDPHFMVWMRTAGLPTFKKLYAIYQDQSFKKGDKLTINIQNAFPTTPFEGEKYVVISTTSWLGGKNGFLGYTYIIVGVICLILGATFFAKHKMSPRALGDMKYFNWPALRPNKQSA